MRMAGLHLVADRGGDIGKGKVAGFFRHAGVEYDLEQQVAELVFQIGHVSPRNGIRDFVGFFNGVRRNAGKVLCQIPFAAIHGIAQPCHDRQEPVERGLLRGVAHGNPWDG